ALGLGMIVGVVEDDVVHRLASYCGGHQGGGIALGKAERGRRGGRSYRDPYLALCRCGERCPHEHGERERRQLQITLFHYISSTTGFFKTLAGEYTSAPTKNVSGTFNRCKNAPACGTGPHRQSALWSACFNQGIDACGDRRVRGEKRPEAATFAGYAEGLHVLRQMAAFHVAQAHQRPDHRFARAQQLRRAGIRPVFTTTRE